MVVIFINNRGIYREKEKSNHLYIIGNSKRSHYFLRAY